MEAGHPPSLIFFPGGCSEWNSRLLEMRNISKQFPGVQALKDVSIDLHAGEVLGLVGENGAGKSTLIKILAGDYRADTGDILINGRKVDFRSPSDAADMGIQFIYQELDHPGYPHGGGKPFRRPPADAQGFGHGRLESRQRRTPARCSEA